MSQEVMVVSLTDGTQVSNMVTKTPEGDLHVLTLMGFMEPQFVIKRESAIEIARRILVILEA